MSFPVNPPPPPATSSVIGGTQLAMAGAAAGLGGVATTSAGLAMPHFGQVVPASRVLFGMQRLSEGAAAGVSTLPLIDLLAIVFLAGGVISVLFALLPRLHKQPSAPAGKPPLPKLKPWLLAFALVVAILALTLAFYRSTAPSLTLILVSLVAVIVDYAWVLRDVCEYAALPASQS
jgi:hypothetical protein